MFGLQCTVQPAVEPVSLDTAKQHLVVQFTEDDALISAYITAARKYAEHYTNRAFFKQTWKLTLDHFPIWNYGTTTGAGSDKNWFFYNFFFKGLTINLPYPTVQSITSITYVDMGGNQQTLDSSLYLLDSNSEPARVSPIPGAYWPYTQQYRPGNVAITYVTGSYGDGVETNTCPLTVVQAILLLVAHWYQNREAASAQNLKDIPLGVNALLDCEKVYTFGLEL